VVIDAYRTDLLGAAERGLGSSLNVLGYRLAMIVSGGIALIWTDPTQGGGWNWPEVYRFMAGLMVARVLSAPAQVPMPRPARGATMSGHPAVLAAVAAGYLSATGSRRWRKRCSARCSKVRRSAIR
jgi:PAT family beta-lactamase induction signal transducer AmpG